MINKSFLFMISLAALVAGHTLAVQPTHDNGLKGAEQFRPKLFKQFTDLVNVPDGMTQDKEGNFYVAGPNLVDMSYPSLKNSKNDAFHTLSVMKLP
jgi:sugar lactone lactonase YvrE